MEISQNGAFLAVDARKLLGEIRESVRLRKVARKESEYSSESFMQVFVGIGRMFAPGFVVDENNSFTYSGLVSWALGHPFRCCSPDGRGVVDGDPTKGLYVYGGTGTGKSLALRVLNVMCQKSGLTVRFGSDAAVLGWDNTRAADIVDSYLRNGDLLEFTQSRIQCIQDLGSEPVETLYMGNRVNVLRQVLEARGDREDRLTLITSNFPLSDIGKPGMYGDRVASRLAAMCNFFFLGGGDRRI